MSINEQAAEQARVTKVVEKINERISQTDELLNKAHHETDLIQTNYGENNSVNLIEADDRIETNAELQQQKSMVSRAVESEAILKHQVGVLDELSNSPYFGRIDIQDAGEPQPEKLYIGTASFVDEDQNFLIYDWRAPISSVYYNGSLGQVDYQSPQGNQSTELIKKRQFLIENGKITNMFDTNETVGDKILQHVLGQQNDEYMQNIVATIQKEQNDIIRDTYSDLLVVQGVAGSGKTSAILQRIAYLLYHSRESLEADQIVLFSPNRLFSHYISEVLPSLGERNMRQVTLAEFLSHRFQGLTVESLFDRYENDHQLTTAQRSIRNFQESAKYIQAIQSYCQSVQPQQLHFTDILFKGRRFFTKKAIEKIYSELPAAMAPADKFLKTQNALIKLLKKRIAKEAQTSWVNEEIDQLSDEQYHELLGSKHRGDFQSMDAEVFYIARKIVTRRLRTVYDAIYNGYFLDSYEQYSDFMQQVELPNEITTADWQQRCSKFKANLEYHKIALIDCAPLLMLRDTLTGSGQNRKIQYIFIDEMQDYSLSQLLYFQHAFPTAKFTLLGDSEQALFKDIENSTVLLQRLKDAFNVQRANLITLNKSYRSTAQITNFAKALLPDGDQIQAFTRDGDLPTVIMQSSLVKAYPAVIQVAQQALTVNKSVAVLTKNLSESRQVYQAIKHALPTTLLTDSDRSLPNGVVVMPIYLAKGLEFDTVIAFDISANNYSSTESVGILYTIASRAMHQLSLICIGEASPLIKQIDPQLFSIKHLVSGGSRN